MTNYDYLLSGRAEQRLLGQACVWLEAAKRIYPRLDSPPVRAVLEALRAHAGEDVSQRYTVDALRAGLARATRALEAGPEREEVPESPIYQSLWVANRQEEHALRCGFALARMASEVLHVEAATVEETKALERLVKREAYACAVIGEVHDLGLLDKFVGQTQVAVMRTRHVVLMGEHRAAEKLGTIEVPS